eukprot:3896294-Prymnesium_polylepis.2
MDWRACVRELLNSTTAAIRMPSAALRPWSLKSATVWSGMRPQSEICFSLETLARIVAVSLSNSFFSRLHTFIAPPHSSEAAIRMPSTALRPWPLKSASIWSNVKPQSEICLSLETLASIAAISLSNSFFSRLHTFSALPLFGSSPTRSRTAS